VFRKHKKDAVGLVLEGGGAKGAYQIGAWKALRELGVKIDTITGTSVGALNGALIAQGDFDAAFDLWYNLKPSMVVKGDPAVLERLFKYDVKAEDISILIKYLSRVMGHGGLDIEPLKNLLATYIDEEKVRNSSIRLGIVTVSLTDFKPIEVFIEDIPEGRLIDYLIASANLPIFKLERLDEKLFIDGGFYDNLPVRLMASSGKKEIVTIELKAPGIRKKVDDESLNIKSIAPLDDIGGLLEFNQSTIRNNLELGYFDTQKEYKGLRGIRYYVRSKMTDTEAISLWSKLQDDSVEQIAFQLGVEADGDRKRILFETLIPRLVAMLNLDSNAGYRDLIFALYESVAQKNKINQFEIYDFRVFKKEVESKCLNLKGDGNILNDAQLPRILKHSNLLLKTFNEDIIEKIFQYVIYDLYYR